MRQDAPDWQVENQIAELIYGSTETFESELERKAPHALELRRGLAIRLNTSEREQIEKTMRAIADQLSDGLLDLPEELLPPDLIEAAEQFAQKLRHWKNESLHELLHDLQRALTSDASEKVKAARTESLVRAIRESIDWAPAPKTDGKESPEPKSPPASESVGAKFRRITTATA